MKFDILKRFTGEVVFTAEIECDDDTPQRVKLGLAIKVAVKARANLSGANLSGANLSDANLSGANLSDADLSDADLSYANLSDAGLSRTGLSRANLSGANLSRTNLSDTIKIDPSEIPIIPQIDAKILAAIEAGGALNMDAWHTCETTHCRAGWAVHLAGKAGYDLQDKVGPQRAGAMIYRASRPGKPAPWFFDTNEHALADIRKCAAEQLAEGGVS